MAKVEKHLTGAATKVAIFKAKTIEVILENTIRKHLARDTPYDPSDAPTWTKAIANEVALSLKDLKMEGYKHIVQVVIGKICQISVTFFKSVLHFARSANWSWLQL